MLVQIAVIIKITVVFFLISFTSLSIAGTQKRSVTSSSSIQTIFNSTEKSILVAKRINRRKKFNVKKQKVIVPTSQLAIQKLGRQVIKIAAPPKEFRRYFQSGTDESELESVINEEITQLFNLLKKSKRRDLRLRLGSLYVEKARLIEYQIYEEYDEKMKRFEAGDKVKKPRLRLQSVMNYFNKAISLFDTYRLQYPKDKKMDQVLFFLGVSYFKKGQLKKGKDTYELLVKKYPKSEYIHDVNFELGEYYFNHSQWKRAAGYYVKLATKPHLRLHSFALYKLAWCRLQMGRTNTAIANLEAVIRIGMRQQRKAHVGVQGAGNLHFANEALNDLTLFYHRSKKPPSKAFRFFLKYSGSEGRALQMLKELAYTYLDHGNLLGVQTTFNELIQKDPFSPESYDYQYQIVRAYSYAGQRRIFLRELKQWLSLYSIGSEWEKNNNHNHKLISKASNLMEATVRNYALRMHQSFRKTKSVLGKKQALLGYELYLKFFKETRFLDQMYFFYADLLFDVKQYTLAAHLYRKIVDNFKDSKYYELASLNGVLAFEKTLPSSGEIKKMVGSKRTFIPFTRPVHDFQKIAYDYVQLFPKKKNIPGILYKMASLHYDFNHYEEAIAQFSNLISQHPYSQYTEYSANLILDIYNLKKDFVGLKRAAEVLLNNKIIAKSSSARGIRTILSQTSLKSAEDLAKQGEYLESAQLYKSFADTHPQSPLRAVAYYNAGVNFRKAGELLKAISLYQIVLQKRFSKNRKLKYSVLKSLPELYEKTGQYRQVARAFSHFARSYPKDKLVADFWFNAALIYDGLNNYNSATQAYLKFFKKSQRPEKVQALYLLAELMRRRGKINDSVAYYQQFLNRNSSDKRSLVESAFKIAKIKKSQKRIKESKVWYQRTVNLYNKYQEGVVYAAQAQFNLVYDDYIRLVKIRIPANPKLQTKVVERKLKLFNSLKESLKRVIRYDSGDQVVASLVLIGLASEHIAGAIYHSPAPKRLNKAEIKTYREGLSKTVEPFKKEAIKNYLLAVKKSRALTTYPEKWLKKAAERLGAHDQSPINTNHFLREIILPVVLYDWSGV